MCKNTVFPKTNYIYTFGYCATLAGRFSPLLYIKVLSSNTQSCQNKCPIKKWMFVNLHVYTYLWMTLYVLINGYFYNKPYLQSFIICVYVEGFQTTNECIRDKTIYIVCLYIIYTTLLNISIKLGG
jgi:hypothetical protein